MSKKSNNPPDSEEQFAQALEAKHAQLMKEADADQVIADEEDQRVQSAMMVLQLLEEFNPPQEPPGVATDETVDDPLTKPSLRKPTSQSTQEASVEKALPDLERLGRFEIIEQVGRGGFGIVVRAHDPQLGRDVAIKIPRFEAALSPQSRQRFEREAKAAAALNHPNIVGILESGSEQGIDFIVTEFVDGENLAAVLAGGENVSTREAVQLVASIADAMEHAHQRGVLHRDLKPSNILLRDSDLQSPLIADFGLATITDEIDFTQTGAVIGTPAYMSPEQAAGKKHSAGPTTDVYGLGTILYQLLTGRSPFADLPLVEILEAIHRRDPEPPRSINPQVPKDLESICLKCLEKNSAKRYSSAQELQADLQRLLSGQPVVARRIRTPEKMARWFQRNPLVGSVGMLAAIFLCVALVASIWGWTSTANALKRESAANAETRKTIGRYYVDVAENDLLDVPGLVKLRRQLMQNALDYYQQVAADGRESPEILAERERAFFRIGQIQNVLGNFDESLVAFDQALSLIDLQPEFDQQSLDSQIRRHRIITEKSKLMQEKGDPNQAANLIDDAINSYRELLTSNDDSIEIQFGLVKALIQKEKLLRASGEFKLGIKILEEAIEITTELMGQDPQNRIYREVLANAFTNQSNSVAKTGNLDQSIKLAEQAIELIRGLIESEGRQIKYMAMLSTTLVTAGKRYLIKRDVNSAVPFIEESAELNDFLTTLFPEVAHYINQNLDINQALGFVYHTTGQAEKAIPLIRANIEIFKAKSKTSPNNPMLLFHLAQEQSNLAGLIDRVSENRDEAKQMLFDAEKNLDIALSKMPDHFETKMAAGFTQLQLSAVFNSQCTDEIAAGVDWDKSCQLTLTHSQRAIDILNELNEEKPGVPQIVMHLPGAHFNLACAYRYRKEWEKAFEAFKISIKRPSPGLVKFQFQFAIALSLNDRHVEAMKILDQFADHPQHRQNQWDLGQAQAAIGSAWIRAGSFDQEKIDEIFGKAVANLRASIENKNSIKQNTIDRLNGLECFADLRDRDDFKQLLDLAQRKLAAQNSN